MLGWDLVLQQHFDKSLADHIERGELENIKGSTSFQSEVLALELDIPLIDLASVSHIDLAIDGVRDEVDPMFQLKGEEHVM